MALGPDAIDGTVVNINGTNYTVTATDLANGFITAAIPVTGEGPVTIHAEAWMHKVTLMLQMQISP